MVGASVYKYLTKELKLLLFFMIFGLGTTYVSYLMASRQINNLWLFHIHTLLEYIVYVTVFSLLIEHKKLKKILRGSIIVFGLIWIVAKIFFEDISKLDNITSSLNSGLLTLVSGYILMFLLFEKSEQASQRYKFWFTSGVLVYYSGCIVVFALSNQIYSWQLHSIFSIISRFLFIGGFITKWRQ